jgi:hypothetical protein
MLTFASTCTWVADGTESAPSCQEAPIMATLSDLSDVLKLQTTETESTVATGGFFVNSGLVYGSEINSVELT